VDVKALLDAGWECAYCATPVGSFTGGARPLSASLDRLIPELGYVPGNVVIACHACNSAKGEHTPQSLREWADRIEATITRMNPAKE
jgi:5-methylcytosine-specific restriction endonuclease McrA